MSKIIKREADLDKKLSECSRVLVLFYASWCPYSQIFLPIFEKYSEGNDQNFCRVVTDRMEVCEEKYAIEVVPTVIYFENGRVVKRLDGVQGSGLTEHQLNSLIRSCELGDGNAVTTEGK
jgi:thioredoxin-like negative regulator of GroEL